jgi:hypothetical protein
MSVIPTSPVYGLNAPAAVLIEMKNGFNFQGGQAEAAGARSDGDSSPRNTAINRQHRRHIGARAYNDDGPEAVAVGFASSMPISARRASTAAFI